MEYRYLGNTGLKTSMLSFGSYLTFGHTVNEKEARTLMDKAYGLGVNLFDNAEVYALGRSEEIMGAAIKRLKWSRDSYIMMTKVFWGGEKPSQMGLHRKHIFDGCHASLKRLGLDYIDIFVCHRPDVHTPMIETVAAMHHLITQGKILYWGTSEWTESQILEAILVAQQHGLTPPSLEQFKYSMLERNNAEKNLKNVLSNYKLGATTTMPLAGGFLTGKYSQEIPKNSRFSWLKDADKDLASQKYLHFKDKLDKLAQLAQERGMTLAQLAIGWCLSNELISSVIMGLTKEKQIDENVRTIQFMTLFTPDFKKEIQAILDNDPLSDAKNFFDYAAVIERV